VSKGRVFAAFLWENGVVLVFFVLALGVMAYLAVGYGIVLGIQRAIAADSACLVLSAVGRIAAGVGMLTFEAAVVWHGVVATLRE
jgi:hypothetical protein